MYCSLLIVAGLGGSVALGPDVNRRVHGGAEINGEPCPVHGATVQSERALLSSS